LPADLIHRDLLFIFSVSAAILGQLPALVLAENIFFYSFFVFSWLGARTYFSSQCSGVISSAWISSSR
jgi:hypothetical protein